MKTSSHLSLFVAGLAFAATAWAQGGSGSASGSSTGTATQPSTGSTLRDPSTLNSNQQTSGPAGVGFGTRSTTSPSTTAPGQTSSTPGVNAPGTSSTTPAGGSNADLSSRSSPGLNHFTALDADHDGRISINEFTSGSTSLGSQGSVGASVNGGVTTNTAPRSTADINSASAAPGGSLSGQSDPSGASVSQTRSPNAGFSGSTAPNVSTGATVQGANSTQLFHQLDANNDGYLSRSELMAGGQNTVTQP